MSEIQHEGSFLVGFEKFDAPVGVSPGKTGHVTIDAYGVAVVKESHRPVVVSPQRPPVIVEALIVGDPALDVLAIGDIPFADTAGSIANRFQKFGKCDLTFGHGPSLAADGIATGQQRRARRPANRLCIEIGEACAFLRQLIQSGRADCLRPVTGEVAVALIVGEDDHKIGFPPLLNSLQGQPPYRSGGKRRCAQAFQKCPSFHNTILAFDVG